MSDSSKDLGLSVVDLMIECLCSCCSSFFLLEVLDFRPHQAGMATTTRRRCEDEREQRER